jgi:Family of unknown function (DUF5343)
VATDGSPTEIYKRFRNVSTGGSAVATAVKNGYAALGNVNEYFYRLSDKDLLSLIVQVSGAEADDKVAKLTHSTLKALKAFASFEAPSSEDEVATTNVTMLTPSSPGPPHLPQAQGGGRVGLNLGYTFNLNLPATSDQAVFNAIFRSFKEHLLTDE